jgi:hypothetical protein
VVKMERDILRKRRLLRHGECPASPARGTYGSPRVWGRVAPRGATCGSGDGVEVPPDRDMAGVEGVVARPTSPPRQRVAVRRGESPPT